MKKHLFWAVVGVLLMHETAALAVNPEYALTILSRLDEKSGPISAIVTVTTTNGKQAQFENLLPVMKTRCETEKGMKIFVSARALDSTTRYSIYTVWETVADLKHHLSPDTDADLKAKVFEVMNGPAQDSMDVALFKEFK
jgi:heme-degrading monooxygenase HmoA